MNQANLSISAHQCWGVSISHVQVCHQRLSSAFDLLIFLCSLILTLTPPPNNSLLADMDIA